MMGTAILYCVRLLRVLISYAVKALFLLFLLIFTELMHHGWLVHCSFVVLIVVVFNCIMRSSVLYYLHHVVLYYY